MSGRTKSVEKHDELWLLGQALRLLGELEKLSPKADKPMCRFESTLTRSVQINALNRATVSHVVEKVWKYNFNTIVDVIRLGIGYDHSQYVYRQVSFREEAMENIHCLSGGDEFLLELCSAVLLAAVEDILTTECLLRRKPSREYLYELSRYPRNIQTPPAPKPAMIEFVRQHQRELNHKLGLSVTSSTT
jgi:hypothetical protein